MKPIYRYSWEHKDWIVFFPASQSWLGFLVSDLIQNYGYPSDPQEFHLAYRTNLCALSVPQSIH